MLIQVNNVNTNVLHKELIDAGLVPTLVTSSGITTSLYFEDTVSSDDVQDVIDVHDASVQAYDDDTVRTLYKQEILTKTSTELRTLFRSLNAEQQLHFREAFSRHWGEYSATQTDINLVFESCFRILFKYLYIKEVEERALTEGEQTELDTLLGYFNDHNTALEPYLPRTGWCLPLINRIIDRFNTVRFANVFPNLAVITGPIIETRTVTSTIEPVEGDIATTEVT